MAKTQSGNGRLWSLPHRELKEIAKKHRIPATGTVDELRDRLERALSPGAKERLAGSFLQTKQAFSYRYYRLKRGSSRVDDVVKAVSSQDKDKDPFQKELRPPLSGIPQVYSARVEANNTLFLHLAFAGDERLVRDGWGEILVVPPIFAVVALRESEGVLELRGRWEKVPVIEGWLEEKLSLKFEHLSFDWKSLKRLKKTLKAKLGNQTIRPNAGGIGTIRIAASGKDIDLDENESGEEIRKVFEAVGYEPGNPGFVYHPTEIRVRANDKQGSFYIPKHAREEEVTVLRHAFLVVKGVMKKVDFKLPEPVPDAGGRRMRKTRLLKPDVLQQRLARLKGYSNKECRTIENVLSRLQRHQQERLLPAIWDLWLPGRAGEDVMRALVGARVLRRTAEARCMSCEFIGEAEGYPAECPECDSEIAAPTVTFALRGYLDPKSPHDQVYSPDYRKLAIKHSRVISARRGEIANKEKKESLEDLAEYLFASVQGLRCTGRNVLTANHEVDRIFRNGNKSHPLVSKFGGPLRLECKNTNDVVSSAELGTFVDVLRDCNSPFGVYVSTAGYSGMPRDGRKPKNLRDALLTARDARRDGIKVLMLTGAHLEAVCEEGRSLVDVLWEAMEYLENL